MPQTYQPADGGTFDFGEAYVLLGGRETKVHLGSAPGLLQQLF